jgi:hypothetical protein
LSIVNSSTEQVYGTAMEAFQVVVEFDKLKSLDYGRVDRRSLPTGGSPERLDGSMMTNHEQVVRRSLPTGGSAERLDGSMVARS